MIEFKDFPFFTKDGESTMALVFDFLKAEFAYTLSDRDDNALWERVEQARDAIPDELIEWLEQQWPPGAAL